MGFDFLGQGIHVGDVLTDGDHGVTLALGDTIVDLGQQFVLVEAFFRHDHELCTAGYGGRHGQITTVATHDFHNRDPLVRSRGVTQTVNRFHHHVQCGVETDSKFGTGDIVIDGAWQADAGISHLGQLLGAHIGAVTTHHDQRIDTVLLQVFDGFTADRFFFECRETCRAQKGAAAIDHVGNAMALQFGNAILMQAQVTVTDTVHLQTGCQTGTNHSTNSCVHTW